MLATSAAASVEWLAPSRWLHAFGGGAAPVVVGLFGVMAWNLARSSVTSWSLAVVAALALVLAARTKIAPALLLLAGLVAGGFLAWKA